MKKFPILIGLMAFLVSCTPPDYTSQASIDVVNQYLEAVDNNDYQLMESLLADNYLGLGPSIDDSTNKKLALESWQWNIENLYDKVEFDRTETFASTISSGPNAGNWAYNWARVTITYQDGSGPVSLLMNAVYKIEEGKIARSRTFYNEADVWEQLGYRIFPPLEIPEGATESEQ